MTSAGFWRNISVGSLLISMSQIWETYSYFGLRSIVVLFLTSSAVMYSDKQAFGTYLAMVAMADVLAIISGRLGDSKIGNLRAAMLGSFVLAMGFFLISLTFSPFSFSLGASCLSVGVSLYRPNSFAILGKQMRERAITLSPGDTQAIKARMDSGMALVYGIIDIGFIMAYLGAGLLMHTKGWIYTIRTISISMFVAIFFILCLVYYERKNTSKFITFIFNFRTLLLLMVCIPLVSVCLYAIMNYNVASSIVCAGFAGFCLYFTLLFRKLDSNTRKKILAFIVYLTIFVMFIMLERQIHTSLPLFFSRNIDRRIFNIEVPVGVIYSIMPLSVIFMGPINAYFLNKWKSNSLLPGIRCIVAFSCLSIAYSALFVGCHNANSHGLVKVEFALIAAALFAFANTMLVPAMLSMASRLAPRNMNGVFVGSVFVWIGMGTVFAKFLSYTVAIEDNQHINLIVSLFVYKRGFGIFALCTACLTVLVTLTKILLDTVVSIDVAETSEISDVE